MPGNIGSIEPCRYGAGEDDACGPARRAALDARYGPVRMDHMKESSQKTEIGVTAFKARCLELIDDVAKGRKKRVLLTRRGRAVAALVPLADKTARKQDPWGGLRGTVTIPAGLDLTRPTGEAWNAEIE